MKIIIEVLNMLVFGLIGMIYKSKLKSNYLSLIEIKKFEEYYDSNIILFKNDIHNIINNYIIMQKNKTANNGNLFIKIDNIYTFNFEKFKSMLDETVLNVVNEYLNNIGKNEYEFEKEKNQKFYDYISNEIKLSKDKLENKGNLVFKLSLAIGAVIGIILW